MSNNYYLVLDETCRAWENDENSLRCLMYSTFYRLMRQLESGYIKFMTLHYIFNEIDIALPKSLEKIQYIFGVTNVNTLIKISESITMLHGGIDQKFKGVQITVDLDDCEPFIRTCPCCGNKIYY